jgi:hypothetical protein
MDFLPPGYRLADIVLGLAVVRVAKTFIDDSILQIDQLRFAEKVLLLGGREERDEALGLENRYGA